MIACKAQLRGIAAAGFTKQTALPAFACVACRLRSRQDQFRPGIHARTICVEIIKRANSRQVLDLPFVQQSGINAVGEIVKAGEVALFHPLLNQSLHRLFTDVFNTRQCIADG